MFTTQREELLQCPLPPRPATMDRRWKPNVEIAPNCPRCNSSNTKFCYYNNYSLTQPRYFCKSCRRYWTKGGSLRNVPIGGGCRKNRRSRSVPISTNRASTGSSSCGRSGISSHDELNTNGHAMSSSNNLSKSDSSNIDLALVYAKFLNQQPADSSPEAAMPELQTEFDPSYDLLSVSDTTQDATHAQFSQDQCIVGSSGGSDPSPEAHHMFLEEFDMNYEEQERLTIPQSSVMEASNFGLHPLPPSENLAVQDMYWANSPMVGTNFSWQGTQLQGFDQVIGDDRQSALHTNPLDDNWSSFDLSNFEAFSRP